MLRHLSLLLALFIACIIAPATLAADYVWIEAETPTTTTPAGLKLEIGNDGAPQYLSGNWLHLFMDGATVDKTAPNGVVLSYQVNAPKAATYEIWARIGFQASRHDFDWHLDAQDWQTVKVGDPFMQLQQLQLWNDITWMHFGDQALTAGQHTFEFRIPKALDKGKTQDMQFACDCMCFSAGPFHPNDKYKPDDISWQTDADKAAGAKVFDITGPTGEAQAATPLSGAWQMARYDEATVHDPDGPIPAITDEDALAWKAINIPGGRDGQHPEWLYSHRYLLRTHINVPAALAGRSFVLHFPALNMLATVFVNGQACGFDNAPIAAWDCDITKAVKAGQSNEVVVGIKDWYYALPDLGAKEGGTLKYIPTDWVTRFGQGNYTYPVWNHDDSGILRVPSLLVGGAVYTADVFCKPSVANNTTHAPAHLTLEITLNNPSNQEHTVSVANFVAPFGGGAVEKTFAPQTVTIPAGVSKTVTLSEAWENPKLWWPDAPQQYHVTSTLSEGGKAIDARDTKFGFREWSWDGDNFRLNGVPFHGRADTDLVSPLSDANWLTKYRTHGQSMVRVWNEEPSVNDELDWYDAHGVNVRRTSIFDGEMVRYKLENTALWDHYRTQLATWIKGQRNHPSIFIWSVENEVTFINGHVCGQDQLTTDQHHKTAQAVTAADPTRPFMVDGGNALLDESFPVYGGHYMEPTFQSLPESAYDRAAFAHRQSWPITQHKPVLLGEAYYWNGNESADFATTGGESAFVGRAEAAPAIGLTGKMLSEGYRWNDVNFHFWGGGTSNLYYNSWQPTAVLCRQWDSAFAAGESVARTLKIFNDSHDPTPITLKWTLTFAGKQTASDTKIYTIAPGMSEQHKITLPMPTSATRLDGAWTLTLSRGGIEVYKDVKPIAVLPSNGLIVPTAGHVVVYTPRATSIAVFDPTGAVQSLLKSRGIAFAEITAIDQAPLTAKVLVVGANALTHEQSSSSALAAYAAPGRAVIVLEQENPLRFQALPGAMETSQDTGDIAFAQDLDNPIFAGLKQSDFFTWGDDAVVYRNAYRKPTSSGLSLVQCGWQLKDTALAEMTPGKGLLLLSQLTIGERLANNAGAQHLLLNSQTTVGEPLAANAVAQRLLLNMIGVGLAYKQTFRQVAAAAATNPVLGKTLDAIGVQYAKADSALAAIAKPGGIAVIDATPDNLAQLAANQAAVTAFTQAGGWIILNNVTPEGLASYNKLVGVEHIIRRFGQNATQAAWFGQKHIEKVTFAPQSNPLLAGLSPSNVVIDSGKQIFDFMAGQFPDEDGYSFVVDTSDVAPFATSPWYAYGNATNGFTQQDGFWPLIMNFQPKADGSPYQIPIKLARPETISKFSYAQDLNYWATTKISLLFDGVNKQSFDVKQNGDVQAFDINPPQKASDITLEIDAWAADPAKGANIGLDNIWLYAQRTADYNAKVKPMLNIGAMVEYPKGPGGIVLCNVKLKDTEGYPENVGKKQTIIATILKNLQAPFSGGKSIIAGAVNLSYSPLDISKQANQYKNDQGWFGDKQHTFADLPSGAQRLAGVSYNVYNLTTSPVPTIIMLGGDRVPGLADHVNGIPVGRKADALFFLQAARIDYPRNGDETKNNKYPEMADYVVHYADGTTVKVPVQLGNTIDDYHQATPNALPGAQIAWSKPYAAGGLSAVAYSQQWNNPHPDLVITSIDLVYGPERRGIPALLAITAATAQ